MEIIKAFLLENGLIQVADNRFKNSNCEVTIHADIYQVKLLSGIKGSMYSNDQNIYWLIGVLTYNELINRDYKIPK